MRILGITKSSFIDYPGKISTVIFTGGCNFKCPYCHNGPLVNGKGTELSEIEVLKYIKGRKKYIDAVCISGGEPTLQENLQSFIRNIKGLGFSIKLDTNGTNPSVLKELLDEGLLDYVAMDIKAPYSKYNEVTNSIVDIEKVKESAELLKSSSIDYQLRTTICKELLTFDDIMEIAEISQGAPSFALQNFKDNEGVLEGKGLFTPYDKETLKELKDKLEGRFKSLEVRGI